MSSAIHWVIVALVLLAWIIPAAKILSRLGLPPALSLLFVFPPLGLIGVWLLAFKRWPIPDAREVPSRY